MTFAKDKIQDRIEEESIYKEEKLNAHDMKQKMLAEERDRKEEIEKRMV